MKQAMLYVRSRVCLGCGKELTAEERKLRVEYCSQKCNTEWSEANPLPVVEGVTGQSEYDRRGSARRPMRRRKVKADE